MATQVEIAKHLDLTDRMVRELQSTGIIPKGGSLDECRVAYIRSLRERAIKRERPVSASDEELAIEKLRLTRAQADKAEKESEKIQLDLDVQRGKLLPSEEVETDWSNFFALVRAKLMAFPARIAPQGANMTTRELFDLVKALACEALEELHAEVNADAEEPDEEQSKPVPPATPGPDGDAVGGQGAKAKRGKQRRTRAVSK